MEPRRSRRGRGLAGAGGLEAAQARIAELEDKLSASKARTKYFRTLWNQSLKPHTASSVVKELENRLEVYRTQLAKQDLAIADREHALRIEEWFKCEVCGDRVFHSSAVEHVQLCDDGLAGQAGRRPSFRISGGCEDKTKPGRYPRSPSTAASNTRWVSTPVPTRSTWPSPRLISAPATKWW